MTLKMTAKDDHEGEHKDDDAKHAQKDILSQFDLSGLSMDVLATNPAETDDDSTTATTHPIDPGLGIDTACLGTFNLDQFRLIEKAPVDTPAEKASSKPTMASHYAGQERRNEGRRQYKDRRNQSRFDGSDRRQTQDRRTSNASPWAKGYQL